MNDEIVIAVSGGIAAYKSCELVRNLVKSGYPVQVIMTKHALNFIGKTTFEALSGKSVYYDEFENGMLHIDMKNKAKVFAIVPATANTIGKLANGIADDLVSTTYMASNCPVIIAPAMNPNMYNNKALQRNLKTLINDDVKIIEPGKGKVVCGDEGTGKLADIQIIQKEIEKIFNSNEI